MSFAALSISLRSSLSYSNLPDDIVDCWCLAWISVCLWMLNTSWSPSFNGYLILFIFPLKELITLQIYDLVVFSVIFDTYFLHDSLFAALWTLIAAAWSLLYALMFSVVGRFSMRFFALLLSAVAWEQWLFHQGLLNLSFTLFLVFLKATVAAVISVSVKFLISSSIISENSIVRMLSSSYHFIHCSSPNIHLGLLFLSRRSGLNCKTDIMGVWSEPMSPRVREFICGRYLGGQKIKSIVDVLPFVMLVCVGRSGGVANAMLLFKSVMIFSMIFPLTLADVLDGSQLGWCALKSPSMT